MDEVLLSETVYQMDGPRGFVETEIYGAARRRRMDTFL